MTQSTVCEDSETLKQIDAALQAAKRAVAAFVPGNVKADFKRADDPVTEADLTADRVLRETLLRDGEGWLSEESADDWTRLNKERVWVVDPLDGTREFVAGIPEWYISIGLVENGRAIAGGICNPTTGETFLGSLSTGLLYNGKKASPTRRRSLAGATVLASRSELKRGEWDQFRDVGFMTRPVGSVAYKLALVSAGLADATWTLCPKNEWDIAAGVALIEAAGGFVQEWGGAALSFNNKSPLKSGLLASGPDLKGQMLALLESPSPAHACENRQSGGRR